MLLLLLAIAVAPTAGTAGGTTFFPFTGDMEFAFPCCGAEPPTATGGVLEAIAGDWICFFVALAYVERAVGCAGTAARGDVVPEADDEAAVADCATLMGLEAGWIVLVIRAFVGVDENCSCETRLGEGRFVWLSWRRMSNPSGQDDYRCLLSGEQRRRAREKIK